jgi:uncharacterized membrane protein YhiD involved in acid resistance
VWTAAAIGTLIGIGLTRFGVSAALLLAVLLYLLRKLKVSENLEKSTEIEK